MGDDETPSRTIDPPRDVRASILRVSAIGNVVATAIGLVAQRAGIGSTLPTSWGVLALLASFAVLVLAPRAPRVATGLFLGLCFATVTGVSAAAANDYPATTSLYLLLAMLAGLLVSTRAAIVVSIASGVAFVTLEWCRVHGHLPDVHVGSVERLIGVLISFAIGTPIFLTALHRMQEAHAAARAQTAALAALTASLERTVDERTRSLVAARDAADAASRAKSAFLANMSHELRTPLNAIVGLLELLRARPIDDDDARMFTALRRASDALLAVLDDTVDLARLEAHRLTLVPLPCAPAAVVHEVTALLSAEALAVGIALHEDVDDDVPDAVLCDPKRLRQVLLNLVVNAIKFTPQGSVTVRVRAEGPRTLRFTVVDTGIGIAPDQQQRLFQPFVQVDASSTRTRGGAGLGLAICRELVTLMGGTIDVDSAPGRGSAFSFCIDAPPTDLPVARSSVRDAHVPVRLSDAAPLRGLVVEDNAVNRAVLELMLRRLGVHVVSVDGGKAALERLAAETFDVVLLDVQMPGIDGLQVARTLCAAGTARPWLIAVTAQALAADEQTIRSAGVDDYITKPVHIDVLADALARVRRPADPASPLPTTTPSP